VTNTRHDSTSIQAVLDELQAARIYGGMHFRSATVAGAALGASAAQWMVKHHFQLRGSTAAPSDGRERRFVKAVAGRSLPGTALAATLAP
jgi:hypothetical protein